MYYYVEDISGCIIEDFSREDCWKRGKPSLRLVIEYKTIQGKITVCLPAYLHFSCVCVSIVADIIHWNQITAFWGSLWKEYYCFSKYLPIFLFQIGSTDTFTLVKIGTTEISSLWIKKLLGLHHAESCCSVIQFVCVSNWNKY